MSVDSRGPRVGIIGTGAIGGFYGLMLARAGYDVHFLLRSEFDTVAREGLQVKSAVHGELSLKPFQAYRSAAEMPPCDWLLVGTKSTGNAALGPIIRQVAAPNASVLLLQNGLAVEDQLRNVLPDSLHILGGLCFVCVNRVAPGVVAHEAFGAVSVGYHSGPADDEASRMAVVEACAALFKTAGIDAPVMANLQQARWQKLVWNVPYNGLSALLQTSTGRLMADPDSQALIRALMDEVVQGAEACGHTLPPGFAQHLFTVTENMPDYRPSMYHDLAERRPLELDAIYARPLAAALAAGFDMPRVRALYQALAFIDRGNRPASKE
ncbi:putative 2-dehydropantoate 2-reductase [Pseudomonas syringae pv. syringae]|uniref:putative 2-dehydropantoate 2-reductase n=1 Tax=Pseudomonas syringae TaxID=317 RepID=UPI000CDB5AD1|nr:putative 2-dehydropantoate 2-reductase [Pseudomonas syringae]MCH5528912.1 putative 2-dehydropantoate 2-reductase [Pseudomonas syringae pv. syringae]MCH5538643.1 putative 2-dehydropantoate 2-reductase [Pseudomonas syringae pv. syringae]MCH5543659.1 putative 2-dehydropantoate 2-reductase [Pseudomonas syringae pv. syringae]MCH5602380.1 putative 2-dehydropantoate 2-reductase [Pseudomonas syringae pv. syringae]MCH5606855.1 putative 2-dehydropantoate 2-reductase [Pseudomonas syringae pv. syringae